MRKPNYYGHAQPEAAAGVVRDASRAVLPGVRIIAKHPKYFVASKASSGSSFP